MHRTLSTISMACQTDESAFFQVVNMDTDDDESEIDDGEEEERVKRRRRSVLQTPIRQGIVPTVQTDSEKKKKATIELKIPSTLDRDQVCYFKKKTSFKLNALLFRWKSVNRHPLIFLYMVLVDWNEFNRR